MEKRERKRKWTQEKLTEAVASSTSIRQVLSKLGLIEAGGNYAQIKKYISLFKLDIKHFTGTAWNKGLRGRKFPWYTLDQLLVKNSTFQSHKLKQRLFGENLKSPKCERCGWAEISPDGRLPLELDHINGDRNDNRFKNLRILCPNCHSLQPTHRAKNIRKKVKRMGEWRNRYTRNT